MPSLIRSLHHVTATADDAQADLDFYARLLGMRLVKKTVNFDNPGVYHFYYGNEQGTPGTIWTTFPYKGMGVPVGTKGAGQITTTSFSVPQGSLDFWRARLEKLGASVTGRATGFGEDALTVIDPSGLIVDLVANARDQRPPWVPSDVPGEHAIRGLHSVTLTIRHPAPTIAFLKEVLGFTVVNEARDRTRLGVGTGDEPGKTVEILHSPDAPEARNGLGTVHHVAFAVESALDQVRKREELLEMGWKVTEVLDRQYFTSIYFREPGGVLYEIATIPPGFAIDETVPELGRGLKLPPWEEPRRAQIESVLPKVVA
ncbi:MAG TPA: ring-cleaving dioxygenase [Gemmatimonadales bacterium]|nr:ring-cleaving dioxygenase [Gemmatimonadales bacterium]